MLVLHSTSRCDVCLLEYSWETSARVPHAIACGHIFCRDCLYATIPPLCPLCRKQYQPAKIKKLHVDRPENVDEAREVELGKQQLELLEKLVDIWDLELQEDFISKADPIEDDNRGRGEITQYHEGRIFEGGSVPQGRLRILANLELVNGAEGHGIETNENTRGLRSDENALQLDRGEVEQILDGIAGTPGVGRRFLDRWGPEIGNNNPDSPIVTMREARRAQYQDVLRQVDLWLESKDEESGLALRKSRRFLTEFLAVRTALKEAIITTKSMNMNNTKLLSDLQAVEGIRIAVETERDTLQRYVDYMTAENQELKARLQSRPSPERYRPQSSPLRNPLPAPPQPVASDHLPTFAQAVSEASASAAGSVYGPSIYSPPSSNYGVRFVTPPPSSSGRARERYTEDHESPNGNSSRSSRRKGKGRESSHSYSYRDDSGYFEGENYLRGHSSSSKMYPNSAPAAVDGHTARPTNHYGTNSVLQATQAIYNAGYDPGRSRDVQTQDHGYATRSTRLDVNLDASQPIDAFALTSAYLKEYSAGYVNGQEAAMGVGPFGQVMSPYSGSTGSSKSGLSKGNSRDSILYTADSAGNEGRGRTREHSTRTSARSGSGHRSLTSWSSNPQLAAILSPSHPPQPARRHMPTVSLPSTSSHGHPSPSSLLLNTNNEWPAHTSSASVASAYSRELTSPTSTSSSGLPPPPPLPQDPAAAEAILLARHPPPSVHSQQTVDDWGSEAQSNSLIRGLRGLPRLQGDGYDSVSVRTRDTRISVDFAESVTDSRRDSRVSDVSMSSRSARSRQERRNSSPARPVDTMVGVLPLNDHDPDSPQRVDDIYTTNRSPSVNVDDHAYRSSTAVDRRMASDSTVRGYSSSATFQTQQTRSRHHQSSQQTIPTDAQRIAANTGWGSNQDWNYETAPIQYSESRTSSSRLRERDDRANHDDRDDDSRRRRQTTTTQRSQTSMGVTSSVEPAHSGSNWSWGSESNAYQAPFSYTSQVPSRTYETLSPTSQPPATHSGPSTAAITTTNSNPPSSYRSHRDRDRDVERSSRSRNHHQEHGYSNNTSSSTRPSLLGSRETSNSFPVSVESTDDERYPGTTTSVTGATNSVSASTRSRTAMHNVSSSGRSSTRVGGHTVRSSSQTGGMNNAETTNLLPPPPQQQEQLQSFGNALGLELNTTANGISAPRPVSSSSTQNFLRSWSRGH